jgi:uncharacterized protein YbaR (Trm112 family)
VFIELVDALRCPVSHEESWLVAATTRMESRHIMEGTLGCPVCAAEYPIANGVVDFRRSPAHPAAPEEPSDPQRALKLAALLDLTDNQGFAVLLGAWGNHATELAAITEIPLILVDPPAGITGSPGISVLRCDGVLPLAATTARAIALDTGDAARVASAVNTTRPKGRVVAPITIELPDGITELARDASVWVGERVSPASPLITLHVHRS